MKADRGSLFLVQGKCTDSSNPDAPKKFVTKYKQIKYQKTIIKFVSFKYRCLVSKLFDVCPRSTLEEMKLQEEVRVAWGTGIAGYVAESGDPVNISDAYQVSSSKKTFS